MVSGRGTPVPSPDNRQALLRDRVFQLLAPLPAWDQTTRTRRFSVEIDELRGQLARLGMVCQQWHKLATFLLVEGTKRLYTIEFKTGTQGEACALMKRIQREGGDHVQQLTIIMGEEDGDSHFYERFDADSKKLLRETSWWEKVLGNFPNVVRLDLSRLGSASTATVLGAILKTCPKVQELEFRSNGSRSDMEFRLITASNEALEAALRAWYAANGGLRFLTLPFWLKGNEYTRLLTQISEHAPNIEYLELRVPKVSWYVPLLPMISNSVWTTFCQRCTKLRAFD